MKNLDLISEELFNKIRGRFPSVTIGNADGQVTNKPNEARFFDFDFKEGAVNLGKVSVSVSEEAIEVMYSDNFVAEQDEITKEKWYNFLKELRQFSKKRLMKFDTRNINKSNLDRRDYQFLATNRGDNTMAESKMYGTSKISYQNVDNARLVIKHTESVNQESVNGRIRNIGKIYIESADGERFLYPYKHLTGARAMARHVAEGGKPFDDFGTHIVGLSEELNKLRKFKSYMGRSSVMAESLKDYMPVVQDRISTVKKTIESLQKPLFYKTAFESFEKPMMEEVPNDVAENWVDQLTIKQFNEELKDVFPYIYNLVSEATTATELGPEGLAEDHREKYTVQKGDTLYSIAREMVKYEMQGMSVAEAVQELAEINGIDDPAMIQPGMVLNIPWNMGAVGGDPITGEPITRGLPHGHSTEASIEDAFESMMGQFAEGKTWMKDGVEMCSKDCCGKPVTECSCGPDCPDCNCYEMNKKNESKTEGIGQFNKYQDHKDLIDDLESGLKDAKRGNDMADFIADELGDYIRAGIEDMGEEKWQDSLAGQALAELDNAHLEGPQAQAKAFQDALNVLKQNEGNKFSKELKKARDNGDDEIELAGKKIPVTEFVLSLFDRETGQFPKGETAVLTAIEKDYGEQYIEPAKQFIERINSTYEQYTHPVETLTPTDDEWSKTLQIPNRETWEKLIKQAKAKGDKKMLGKLMAMGDQIASTEGTHMEPTIGQEEADIRRLAGL